MDSSLKEGIQAPLDVMTTRSRIVAAPEDTLIETEPSRFCQLALERWIEIRGKLQPPPATAKREVLGVDSHLAWIVEHDFADGPQSGRCMLNALGQVPDDVHRSDDPLSCAALGRWHDIATLGRGSWSEAALPAFDGFSQRSPAAACMGQLESFLAQSADLSVPVVLRAVRVYLDVLLMRHSPMGHIALPGWH